MERAMLGVSVSYRIRNNVIGKRELVEFKTSNSNISLSVDRVESPFCESPRISF